ncbi:hypothetical protein [Sporosarcina sp. G11-34]|uniref:hypothetical protein n=1 Tax=Sporosarcina sp. G11-34 TaxID=2849605 RepID=UPI0022A92D0D|nr:hypothetical protein [Sporosarcina sp. G11-34]MCZ2259362.1 hypothetical protein [Sporosarcina sp. G11-34]
MENLIPFIIMLLIGSFFSSKKKKSTEQEKAKPFTAQEPQSGPVGKLKEMYQELQKEMQAQTREQEVQQTPQMNIPKSPVAPKSIPVQVSLPREGRPKPLPKEKTTRRAAFTQNAKKEQQSTRPKGIIPQSQDDLIKGIVYSEIFGPPVSKR